MVLASGGGSDSEASEKTGADDASCNGTLVDSGLGLSMRHCVLSIDDVLVVLEFVLLLEESVEVLKWKDWNLDLSWAELRELTRLNNI